MSEDVELVHVRPPPGLKFVTELLACLHQRRIISNQQDAYHQLMRGRAGIDRQCQTVQETNASVQQKGWMDRGSPSSTERTVNKSLFILLDPHPFFLF